MEKTEIERTELIKQGATAQEVVAEIKRYLDIGGTALNSTFQFVKDPNGLWTAYRVEDWKPPHQQTCVGKSENIAQWLKTLMGKPKTKVIYISIMGVLGYRGMQYAFQEL